MKRFCKLGIATIVCMALSGAAWATSGGGGGGTSGTSGSSSGNSGHGNDLLRSVINLPQVTPPLIQRNGNSHLAPVVSHKLPSNSLTDTPGNRGIGLRAPDLKTNNVKMDNLDRKSVLTKVDEKSEKAETETKTRLAANNTDDTAGARKAEANRPEVSCR